MAADDPRESQDPTAEAGGPGRAWSLGTLALVAALIWLFIQVQEVLFILVGSILLAALLEAPVRRLAVLRFGRFRLGRKGAALAVLLAAVGLLGLIIYLLAPVVGHQASMLIGKLPDYVQGARAEIENFARTSGFLPPEAVDAFEEESGRLLAEGGRWAAGRAVSLALDLLQLLGLLVIPVGTFYVLSDGRRLRREFLSGIPPRWRQRARPLLDDISGALSGYVRGQSAVCAAAALLHSGVFALAGMPFALVIGLVAGLAEAVPFLGAIVVTALVLIIGLAEAPGVVVRALIFYLVANQLVNFLLAPRLMSQSLHIHPFVIILAVLVGTSLAGPIGALVALPTAVVLQTVTRRLWGTADLDDAEADAE